MTAEGPVGRRDVLQGMALAVPALVANFLAKPTPLRSSDDWERRADMPVSTGEMKAATIGDRIYVPGGMSGPVGSSSNRLLVYDPDADHWEEAAPMPVDRNHHAVTALEGLLYVTGGNSNIANSPEDHLLRYDPGANEWEELESLPEGRWGHECVAHDGQLYVVGGETTGGHDVLRFDGGSWHRGAPMPTPREHLAAGVVGDEILTVSGRWGGTNDPIVEAYDPAEDSWRELDAQPTARSGTAGVVLEDTFHLAGGEDMSTLTGWATDRHERLTDDGWESAPSLPLPLHGPATAVHDDTMYVIGGAWRHGLFSITSWSDRVFAYRP